MKDIDAPGRVSYVPGLLVALGWYATLIAGVAVGLHSVPPTVHECSVAICGGAVLTVVAVIFLGGPLLGLVAVTALLLVPVHRRVSSPFLAGTVSASGAMLIGAVLAGVWAVSR